MPQLCDNMYMYADGMDAAQSADDDSDEDVSDIDYFDDGGYATDDSLDEDSCEDDEESEDEESELEEEENYVNRGVKFMSIKYCNECHRQVYNTNRELCGKCNNTSGVEDPLYYPSKRVRQNERAEGVQPMRLILRSKSAVNHNDESSEASDESTQFVGWKNDILPISTTNSSSDGDESEVDLRLLGADNPINFLTSVARKRTRAAKGGKWVRENRAEVSSRAITKRKHDRDVRKGRQDETMQMAIVQQASTASFAAQNELREVELFESDECLHARREGMCRHQLPCVESGCVHIDTRNSACTRKDKQFASCCPRILETKVDHVTPKTCTHKERREGRKREG